MIVSRIILCGLMLAAGAAQAAGLRTRFGEVVVKKIKIGQTYSLDKLINFPLRVVNTGEETVDLKVDVIKPSELRQGYEAITDPSWVKLEKHEFTVEPNHEAVTDVIIQLPNDAKLLGKRLQADIWSRSAGGKSMFAAGMQSRLLIWVDSTPPTEDELKAKYVKTDAPPMDFTLYPTAGSADNVPLGRDVDLKKEFKLGIKLVNPNDQKLNFRIRSVPAWETELAYPKGFEAAYDARWLRPAQEIVTIEPNAIKETALIVNVPDDPRHHGKSFFFAVEVQILEQAIPMRVFYKLSAKMADGKTKP
jgi:hypothetical protein